MAKIGKAITDVLPRSKHLKGKYLDRFSKEKKQDISNKKYSVGKGRGLVKTGLPRVRSRKYAMRIQKPTPIRIPTRMSGETADLFGAVGGGKSGLTRKGI